MKTSKTGNKFYDAVLAVNHAVGVIEMFLAKLVLVLLVVVCVIFISSRFIFHVSVPWADELSRDFLIALGWLGAGYAASNNDHLSIDLLSSIIKDPVKREKVYYNDNQIIDEFASATAIRKLLADNDFREIRRVVPNSTYELLSRETELGNVILDLSYYEKQIIYNLRKMSIEEIRDIPDVNEGLENNIKNAASYTNNLTDFIDIVKSKRYTQSRIQRILICVLLGIKKKDVEMAKKSTPYIRVLGFNENGRELLSRIKKANPRLPVITSVKKFKDTNTNKTYNRMLDIDMLATDIYTMACKNDCIAGLDYTRNMVMI